MMTKTIWSWPFMPNKDEAENMLKASTGIYTPDGNEEPLSIREIAIEINNSFKFIGDDFGVELEVINVGAAPNDCKGDLLPDALNKIRLNLREIGLQMIHREIEREVSSEED
jgi:hypothetical protein